jgi:hypothetical protein
MATLSKKINKRSKRILPNNMEVKKSKMKIKTLGILSLLTVVLKDLMATRTKL